MAVLHRDALEASPLADLHAIASELGIDGFRRLRKAALVDRILQQQGGDDENGVAEEIVDEAADEPQARPRRRRRSGVDEGDGDVEAVTDEVADEPEARPRRRRRSGVDEGDGDVEAVTEDAADEPEARPRRRRGGRGTRGRAARDANGDGDTAAAEAPQRDDADDDERRDEVVEGVVELLGNGSGFVRVSPPEPSDGDVYISAAQVRRCELVSGDRVSGPVRRPRRSERYPSLVRVDTINGAPAEEVAEGTPYEELPCAFPSVRFELGGDEDPTLKAIEWLTPLGRGSRVVIHGGAQAGKTETLRRLAGALARVEGVDVSLALTGVRPEEVADWKAGPVEPLAVQTLAAGAEAQGQALDRAVETVKRMAARGGHAVLLVDTLDGVAPAVARRALAAARAIVDGGSLTVIATASAPLGGETTVIGLDTARTAARNFPALDLETSATMRPELLVGDAGAEAIASAHAGASE
ncbi:MAG: transcription termination factor Rho [Solirubrobacteraceae bacterium]|jgi:transcription termination factor Rho|nr:transcription termination factor Rho [Solirubrobacteraceae bacterium]